MSNNANTTTLSPENERRYALITANLQEVMRGDIIRDILPRRPLKIYWGSATTGRPHAAYLVPAMKIAQLLEAGCDVKVLLADLHGFLDADKAPESLLEARARYYEKVFKAMLRAVGVDQSKLQFVRGSSYQLTPQFSRDLLRLSKKVSVHKAIKASSEIVKTMGEPSMADGIYPMMQLLDEEYLDVDAQFGGVDQRKTFALANDTMKKMGFKTRAHLLNPMVPGLAGGKMSSSDPKSKIDLLDKPATIRQKIAKAYCIPGEVDGNGILAIIQRVLLPFSALRSPDGNPSILIRKDNESEATEFCTYHEIADAYASNLISPQAIKEVAEKGLVMLMTSIQDDFAADEEWQALSCEAYPSQTAPQDEDLKAKKKAERERRKAATRDHLKMNNSAVSVEGQQH
ncbi:MAG: hypothetical protein Q9227_000866 [Pyrenula ochraceoflavens]